MDLDRWIGFSVPSRDIWHERRSLCKQLARGSRRRLNVGGCGRNLLAFRRLRFRFDRNKRLPQRPMEVLWRRVDMGRWLPTRQSIGILRNAGYSQCEQRPRWSLLQLSLAWQRRQFLALRRGRFRLDRASGLYERSMEVQ